jgi:hypothetical protein
MPETPSFSIGIEEEYQIVDPQTRELKSYITELLEAGKITVRRYATQPRKRASSSCACARVSWSLRAATG